MPTLACLAGPPAEGFSDTLTHRLYGVSAVSNTIYLEVAEPLAHRRESALEAGLALLLPLLVLIPVSLLRLVDCPAFPS
jgi:two-component system OmpR family sensor kinase